MPLQNRADCAYTSSANVHPLIVLVHYSEVTTVHNCTSTKSAFSLAPASLLPLKAQTPWWSTGRAPPSANNDCSHLLKYARIFSKWKLNNILCTILHNICKDKSYKIPLLTKTFLKDLKLLCLTPLSYSF